MQDILSEIVAHKKKEVALQKERVPFTALEKQLPQTEVPFRSLKEALLLSRTGIIAEFKRCSPSKGWINQSARADEVTRAYEAAGAAALSVLTDETFFGGSLADLQKATQAVQIPVMRKEFIVDVYQLFEAKLAGASAVLLIAAAITARECRQFTELAHQLQLEVLLELHDERETEYITPIHKLIGVNNRNLGSFVTDLQKSFRMAELLPKETVWVSESGISDPVVLRDLRNAGYKGFLIGENFMKTADPGENLRKFLRSIES
ncbi:MAG: indole-3-glycerol phosphate synthase TrpC [Porphyromonadaceae bacterium]|nr:indole-3-glycerol phosphate synthase TrpC [Porphyromonadaceae bacterium]